MSHQCPAPECTEQVDDSVLMCPLHWWKVPESVRDGVPPEGIEPTSLRYLRAAEMAVEALYE